MDMYSVDVAEAPKRKQGRVRRGLKRSFVRFARRSAQQLPMTTGFFLLSLARCLSLPSPYAICCLTALLGAGERPWGAFAGLGAGLGFRILWGIDWDVWQFAACALCIPWMYLPERKVPHVTLMTGLLLAGRALPGMATAGDARTVILYTAGIALGLVSMPALNRAVRIAKNRAWQVGQDDLICLALPCLLLIAGAGQLSAFRVNVGYMISAAAVLLLAWHAGGAAGVCAGMGCGMALLLGGQSALLLIKLSLGALVAGFFQGKNRLLAAGVFLLAGITASYVITASFHAPLFLAELTGCLAFCLIPARGVRRIGLFIRRLRWSQPKENAYTRLKMQRWVQAIDSMADALPHSRMDAPSPEEEGEALMEKLCDRCDRLPICWHDHREETKAAIVELVMREKNEEDSLASINRHFSGCERIAAIPELLSQLEQDRLRRQRRAICADYERDMLQTHLTALSQAAQRISLEGLNSDEEEAYWLSQAEETLQAMRFPGQAAFVKRVDGRMTVCLKCDPLSLRQAAGDMLERQLSARLGVKLRVTEQEQGRILMEEEPPLRVITGMATVSAATRERKKKVGQRPDNGDAVLVRPLQGGFQLLALSDGMGHGAGAQDESKKTLEMLSLCLEAGYSRAQAMTAVNGAMLSATGGEKFATVDLCLIDLWTGDMDMNKLGACESYIAQGQKIQSIEGAALPLGIIEHVRPMEHHIRLGEGDLLLLISDGISDSFADGEEIQAIVRRCRNDSPQHIADELLQEAMIQQEGMPPDDMTVLCARVAERNKRNKKGTAFYTNGS